MGAVPIRGGQPPSVAIDGSEVIIENVRIGDADLLALVRGHEDPVQAVTAAAALGARVMRITQTTVDAAVVEARFAELDTGSRTASLRPCPRSRPLPSTTSTLRRAR